MARDEADRAAILAKLAEVFRAYGYEGASLSLIGQATGLGKGSLYHLFPGGKDEMLAAVLAGIDAWFESQVFARLADEEPAQAIARMLEAVETYFRSGERVCLVGALALGEARDRFATAVQGYFRRWVAALAAALERAGRAPDEAAQLAEEAVVSIQGALVLARALDDPGALGRVLARLRDRLGVA